MPGRARAVKLPQRRADNSIMALRAPADATAAVLPGTTRGNEDVTVIVACFDSGPWLREAVESVLRQEGGPPQVVVVDDGSSDRETLAVVASLPESVQVIRQENAGVCVARNRGLAAATTPYVLFLDADDRLAPDAVAAMRKPLDHDPGLGFAYGCMRFFGAWDGELRFPPYDPFKLLYRHIVGLSALVRRSVLEEIGGFDASFEQFEDWELWLNALAHGWRGQQVTGVTIEYRRHGESKWHGDRRRFRRAVRQLRTKHRELYRRSATLARASGVRAHGRLVYRIYWAWRPVPARVEQFVYSLRWAH
jgi:glycosyltransferase involved in cell wall biosynthesis